jgi:hypothetical protein
MYSARFNIGYLGASVANKSLPRASNQGTMVSYPEADSGDAKGFDVGLTD